MRCSNARKWIELYCDDELRPEQELLLRKHMRECIYCSDVLRMTERVSSMAAEVPMPDHLRSKIALTVAECRPDYPSIQIRAQHHPISRAAVSWSMAACLTIVLTFAAALTPRQSSADQIWKRAFMAMQKISNVKAETVYLDKDGYQKRNLWYFSSPKKVDFSAGKVWIDEHRGTWEWYPAESSSKGDVTLTEVPFSSEELGTTNSVNMELKEEGSFYKVVVNVTNEELLAYHGTPVRSVNFINPRTYLPEVVKLQKYEDGAWVQFGTTKYEYNTQDPFRR